MKRIAFVGSSGAGKTTLAKAVADRLSVAHIELDSIFHQPGWTPLPEDEFRQQIAEQTNEAVERTGGWTVDGNYNRQSGGLVQDLADTIVWVDTSRPLVMYRVIRRTIRRAVTREELWNGNREPMTNFFAWDPHKNINRWAWTQYPKIKADYEAKMSDESWAHAEVVRLKTPAEAKAWLTTLEAGRAP